MSRSLSISAAARELGLSRQRVYQMARGRTLVVDRDATAREGRLHVTAASVAAVKARSAAPVAQGPEPTPVPVPRAAPASGQPSWWRRALSRIADVGAAIALARWAKR